MIRRAVGIGIPVLAIVATFLSASPWMRGYHEGTLVGFLVAASVLSVAIPLAVVHVLRQRFVVSAGASFGFLLLLLLVVTREPLGFGAIADGFRSGVAQLLSNTLPLSRDPELMVIPVIACWITGAIVGESIARSRSTGAPVIPLFVGFALAFASTAGGLSSGEPWSIALLLCAGVLIFARRWHLDGSADGRVEEVVDDSPGAHRYQPLIYGAAALSVTAVLAGVVVPRLPAMASNAARPERKPPVEEQQIIAPLAEMVEVRREAINGEDRELFSVEVDAPIPPYIPVAFLDEYDGQTWRAKTTFEPTGGRVPDETGERGTTMVNQVVTVVDHPTLVDYLPGDGAWMPQLSRPAEVSGVEVRFDGDLGMVVPVERIGPDTRYEVSSAAATFDLARAPEVEGAVPLGSASRLAGGRDLVSAVQDWEKGISVAKASDLPPTSGAGDQALEPRRTSSYALALADRFVRRFGLSLEREADKTEGVEEVNQARGVAVSTSSTSSADSSVEGQLPPELASTTTTTPPPIEAADFFNGGGTSFVEVIKQLGDNNAGTPEQFATMYALLARNKSIPTRVVTGYRLSPPGEDGLAEPLEPGTHTVSARQIWTWVEVLTADHGWLVVDPTPSRTATDVLKDQEQRALQDTPITPPSTPPTTAEPPDRVNSSGEEPPPETLEPQSTSFPWKPVAGVLALLSLLSFVPLYRLRRRAKRRHGSPTAQVIGAWHETLDTLDRARLDDLESMTATQVAEATGTRFGEDAGRSADAIAQVANAALFFPPGVGPDDATRTWSEVRTLRSAIGKNQSPVSRARGFLRLGRGVRRVRRAGQPS